MKKIAIDTSPLKSDHQFRGVGVYTKNLTEALGKLKTDNFKIEGVNFKKNSLSFLQNHYQLLHYPCFEPFFISLPLKRNIPIIVTAHDLTPLIFPKYFPKGIKGWFRWQLHKSLLKKANVVITDSENSKKDIIRILGFIPNRIRVVYLAQAREFRELKLNKERLNKVRNQYNLPMNFTLYVGDLNRNKNVEGLVQAFCHLKSSAKNLKLVLVGKAFENNNLPELIRLKKLIQSLKLEKEIIILGFISSKDLVTIYNLAKVYCQPSLYEGFGLPVLEAMACGCPVVCANTASLPEIAGPAAIYFDPKKPVEIAQKIKEIVGLNKVDYQEQVRKSLKQAKKFSWQKTAKKTLKIYQEVLGNEE